MEVTTTREMVTPLTKVIIVQTKNFPERKKLPNGGSVGGGIMGDKLVSKREIPVCFVGIRRKPN